MHLKVSEALKIIFFFIYLFIYSHLYSCHAMYFYVLFQREGPMEDWFYQMGNPLKIKNLLTLLSFLLTYLLTCDFYVNDGTCVFGE